MAYHELRRWASQTPMEIHHNVWEKAQPNQKRKFFSEKKPKHKHHKMFRQFFKPPGKGEDEYSREYPRMNPRGENETRFGHLNLKRAAICLQLLTPSISRKVFAQQSTQ